jgi:cytochrome c oxidase subunit 1
MHFLGFEGQPRRTYTYPKGMGWESLNLLSTIGAFLIAASVLVYLVNIFYSAKRQGREPVTSDPWDARTLEWMTSSPPPEYNFPEVPIVTHRDELWHRKYTEDDEGRLVKLPAGGAVEVAEHGAVEQGAVEPGSIHMPSPSYWPLIFALALPTLGYGFVFKNWWIVALGAVIGFFGVSGWAIEPSTEPDVHTHAEGAH